MELAEKVAPRRIFDRDLHDLGRDGNGVAEMPAYLVRRSCRPAHGSIPEDQISDAPQRHWAAEVTREKLYQRLHDELPYASTVETTDWKTLKDGSVRIEQTMYVERESQKKIVLGAGGATIKAISMAARKELQEALERKVHLFMFVKVRGDGATIPSATARWGWIIRRVNGARGPAGV